MNLEQLIAGVLHELPFAFAVLSLTIYSSFVFWFECWRYNYIATLFVCYAVHLIVNSQSPAIPAPVNVLGNPLNVDNPLGGPDEEGDSSNVETPPSIHQTVDYYWREAVRNYQQYQGRTFHRADELSGNLGHIRRPLPFNMQEQLSFVNHDRFYSYIDSHIPVPDPQWALPYQFCVLFRHWQSVIIESLLYDEEIFIDNVSDANYLRTDIQLRLKEFTQAQAQADLQAELISRQLARVHSGTSSQERERASDSGKGKD